MSVRLAAELTLACARLTRLAARMHGEPAGIGRALSILDQFGPMSVSAFAEADGCSQPTATKLLQHLTTEGAVHRRPDPADGRSCLVALSPAGRERLSLLRRRIGAGLGPRLAELSDDELGTLRQATDLLLRLTGRAEDSTDDAGDPA